jgi:hypothetical protein
MSRTSAATALACALLAVSCTDAFADVDAQALKVFEGGSLTGTSEFSLGFLYGAGSRPGGLGTAVSTVNAGVASVSGNPAGLAFLGQSAILLDVLPPLGASVSDIIDIQSRANSALDDALESVAHPDLDPVYPTIDARAAQRSGVISGAFAVRVGRAVVGGAFEEPLSIGLEFVDTGIQAYGETVKGEEGGGDVDVDVRATLEAAVDLSATVDRTTFAAGMEAVPGLGVGVSLSSYRAAAAISGVALGDGIIDYGGTEYAFNDPSDPWTNDLDQSVDGSFSGVALGWTAGASWRAATWLTFDVCYAKVPVLRLDGSLTTVSHTLPAMSEDGFDASEISASQPTLTEREETVTTSPVELRLPSYAALAATFKTGAILATVEVRRYDSDLGFAYEEYEEGIHLGTGVGLQLTLGGFRLGGGVVTGRLVGESADQGGSASLLIPMANVGLGFEVGGGFRVDTLLLALPLQVMRVSVGYEF